MTKKQKICRLFIFGSCLGLILPLGSRFCGLYSGTITDRETGEPLEGVIIAEIHTFAAPKATGYDTAGEVFRETVTDENGKFRFWSHLAVPLFPLSYIEEFVEYRLYKAGYSDLEHPWTLVNGDLVPKYMPFERDVSAKSHEDTFQLTRLRGGELGVVFPSSLGSYSSDPPKWRKARERLEAEYPPPKQYHWSRYPPAGPSGNRPHATFPRAKPLDFDPGTDSPASFVEPNTGILFLRIPGDSVCMDMRDPGMIKNPPDPAVHECYEVGSFYVSSTEITQAQWSVIMEKNPSLFTKPEEPVNMITQEDVWGFAKTLSGWTGRPYRPILAIEFERLVALAREGELDKAFAKSVLDTRFEYGLWCKDFPGKTITNPDGSRIRYFAGNSSLCGEQLNIIAGQSRYSFRHRRTLSEEMTHTLSTERGSDLGFRIALPLEEKAIHPWNRPTRKVFAR